KFLFQRRKILRIDPARDLSLLGLTPNPIGVIRHRLKFDDLALSQCAEVTRHVTLVKNRRRREGGELYRFRREVFEIDCARFTNNRARAKGNWNQEQCREEDAEKGVHDWKVL